MEKTAAPVPPNLEAFIKRWSDREGGAERANYALFLVELCDLIGVQRPDPAGQETERNEYVFERAVRFHHDDGSTSPGRIDLYKKNCFVLEAKQSKKREKGGRFTNNSPLHLKPAAVVGLRCWNGHAPRLRAVLSFRRGTPLCALRESKPRIMHAHSTNGRRF